MKRLETVIVVVAMVLVLVPSALLAGEYAYDGTVYLWGRGALKVKGTGSATFSIKGTIVAAGSGTVTIPSGARYRLAGQAYKTVVGSKSFSIEGRGSVYIHLPYKLTVKFKDCRAVLAAAGRGTAVLQGKGTWNATSWKKR